MERLAIKALPTRQKYQSETHNRFIFVISSSTETNIYIVANAIAYNSHFIPVLQVQTELLCASIIRSS